jgi:hypothetical protein
MRVVPRAIAAGAGVQPVREGAGVAVSNRTLGLILFALFLLAVVLFARFVVVWM